MNFLDLRTVFFINGITACLCTLILVFLWRQNRHRFQGLSLWAVDFAFQTTAFFLIILRGVIPDWASMIAANGIMLTGAFLGYLGLRRFLEMKGPQVHNYAVLVLFFGIHTHFTYFAPNLEARTLNITIGLLIITWQCAWLLLRRVGPGLRPLTRSTGMVFVGFCLVALGRLAVILWFPLRDSDFLKSGPYQILFIASYQLLLVLLSYSLMLMVNRRLLTDIQVQEEKFSKAFHSAPSYAIILSRLSDGRLLEVNDGFSIITGYRPEEVMGKTTGDVGVWANEEDRSTVVAQLLKDRMVREAEYRFKTKSGKIITGLYSAEIIMIRGVPWVLSVIVDITERKRAEAEREKLIGELADALSKVKKLSGLLPICMHCKKVRDDQGYWNQIEAYIQSRSEAEFSHSICRECAEKHYPGMNLYEE